MIQYILPLVLIVLTFILKLVVDETTSAPRLVQSLYELPVNMIFLSLSFFVSRMISTYSFEPELYFVFGSLAVGTIIIMLWKRSIRRYDKKYFISSAILAIVNFSISAVILFLSIQSIRGCL